jgi:hypothetical protein
VTRTALLLAFLSGASPLAAAPWDIETIGGGGVARESSLAISPTGDPAVAYNLLQWVRYSEWNGSSWGTSNVLFVGYIGGRSISLAFDGGGRPHVAIHHWNGTGGNVLWYAIRDDGEWYAEVVDDFAVGASLAIDGENRPHLAYSDEEGVKHAVKVDGVWQVEVVTLGGGASLALAEDGQPRLAYAVGPWPGELRYASREKEGWRFETIDAGDETGDLDMDGHFLALDASGVPHLSYTHYHDPYPSHRDLMYAVRRGGVWKVEMVAPGNHESWGFDNSIAVGDDGNPRIAFGGFELYAATPTAHGWKVETVDPVRRVQDPSIAIDDWGTVRIAYGGANLVLLATDRATVTVSDSPASAAGQDAVRAYPNPFRDSVTFAWEPGLEQEASLRIYDATGRLARALPPATAQTWDGRDGRGRRVSPGIYFIRLEAGAERRDGRITLVP